MLSDPGLRCKQGPVVARELVMQLTLLRRHKHWEMFSIIIPIWSPYRVPADWSTWAFDKDVLERARAALAGGRYFGIGELHLIGGFAPDWRTPVISGLMALAAEYGVPVLLHTEIYFHRKWLQQLSPSISEKLRITNARDLFKKPGSVSESNPSDAGSGERGRVQGQSPDLSFNTQDRLNRSVCRRLC